MNLYYYQPTRRGVKALESFTGVANTWTPSSTLSSLVCDDADVHTSCLGYVTVASTWSDSIDQCQTQGARLASLDTEEKFTLACTLP